MPQPVEQSRVVSNLEQRWNDCGEDVSPPNLGSIIVEVIGDGASLSPEELAAALRIDALERHRRGIPFSVLTYESQLGVPLHESPAAALLVMLEIALEASDLDDQAHRADELRGLLPERFHADIDAALRGLTDEDSGAEEQDFGSPHAVVRIGEVIGGCKIVEILDSGAQGVVYRAVEHPRYGGEIERDAAVKVLHTRIAKPSEVRRFEAESEYLARLSHPGVAKVFRTGRTDDDRPFFVMEYVPGLAITAFADQKRMTITQRLELFRQVCEAIGHIHQRQLIHRDLKPSNILITEIVVGEDQRRPQVKVIDFGLAKSVGARISQASMVTNLGDIIGTLSYMAPEQAGRDQLDVDQRADVFALGAVLYELLTGRTPLDRSGAGSSDQRDLDLYALVRTQERPNAALGIQRMGDDESETAAKHRGLPNAQRLIHTLESELQWIPAYAMRLEPDRRYQTALQLSEDIKNYLESRPLLAGPDSRWYRMRKTARQYRGPIAIAAAMAVVISAGLIASVSMYLRAERETQRSEARAAELENAVTFMENIVLENDPATGFTGLEGGGRNIRLVDVLQRAPALISNQFETTPHIEERLIAAVGRSLLFLGDGQGAAEHLGWVIERGGDDALTTAEGWDTALDLAEALRVCKDYERSMALLEKLREGDAPSAEHRAQVTELRAIVLKFQGNYAEAERQYQDAYQQWTSLKGIDSREALQAQFNRSLLDLERGRDTPEEGASPSQSDYFNSALVRLEETHTKQVQLLGETDPDTLSTTSELASMYKRTNDPESAKKFYFRAIEGLGETIGADHWRTIEAVINYASLCRSTGEHAAAASYYQRAIDANIQQGRDNTYESWAAACGYAIACREIGQLEAGLQRLDPIYDSVRGLPIDNINHDATVNLLVSLYEVSQPDSVRLNYWRGVQAQLAVAESSAEPSSD